MALSDDLRAKDWTFAITSRAAQRRRLMALYFLLCSLGMLFSAALVGYLVTRLRGEAAPPPMAIPPILWLSTALALVGGGLLWASLRSIRRERQRAFRWQLVAAFLLGVGFCTTQSIGLSSLMKTHQQTMRKITAERAEQEANKADIVIPGMALRREGSGREAASAQSEGPDMLAIAERSLEGLVFVIVLLHVLHFTAGMIALATVTWRGLKGRYDHEYHGGLHLCAIYWRFLDIVWIVLFAAFLLTA